MITKVKLSDIECNPFRNLAQLPLDPKHVEEVRSSIESTGLLQRPGVRKKAEGDKYELVYGHTRLEALRQLKGPDVSVEVDVQELDDGAMLSRMVDENRTQGGLDAAGIDNAVLQLLPGRRARPDRVQERDPGQDGDSKAQQMSDDLDPEDIPDQDAGGYAPGSPPPARWRSGWASARTW